jgi:hypothetical protein
MRSLRLASLLLTLLPSLTALADEPPVLARSFELESAPKNILRVNPHAVVEGGVSLEYERIVAPHVGLAISGDYWFAPIGHPDGYDTSAFALTLRPLFYLSDTAPHGWYVAPFVAAARITASGGGGQATAYGYFAGGVAGYSWLIGGRVNIDLAFGAQYVDFGVMARDAQGNLAQAGIRGVLPAGELSLGLAF